MWVITLLPWSGGLYQWSRLVTETWPSPTTATRTSPTSAPPTSDVIGRKPALAVQDLVISIFTTNTHFLWT